MPSQAPLPALGPCGVELIGTGHAHPDKILTNDDLAAIVDTTDEWITQRTGIKSRYVCDPNKGESVVSFSTQALERAIEQAGIDASEIDQVIVATVTGEMLCPSTACRVAANVGAVNASAFDIAAACSGWVYSLNLAHDQIRAGSAKTIAVIGCDMMTTAMDWNNRSVCVLFGDAAGAAIFRRTDDTSKGRLAGSMHADGSRWQDLYLPKTPRDVPDRDNPRDVQLETIQMKGREIYKFAVGTFSGLIQDTLDAAGVSPDEVSMYVCHQSNARMLEAARDRFEIPHDRMYINIDRYGNSSAGSVPLCLSELRQSGKCQSGDLVMFVAFGGGMTWASSLWKL